MSKKSTKAEQVIAEGNEHLLACETCIWYRRLADEWKAAHERDREMGHCMYALPHVVMGPLDVPESIRPPVDGDDYCSKWNGMR